MTHYAIDAEVALQLIADQLDVAARGHRLVAPSRLRSDALATLHRRFRAGELTEQEALRLLDRLATLPIRLLGDRVSRDRAFKLAVRLGWEDTAPAEYLSVAVLQADRLVSRDPRLVAGATGLIPVAPIEELYP